MKLSARIDGDLRRILADELTLAEAAITDGMRDAAEVYPKGRTSLRATGFVFSKAPDIVAAFEDGTVIRSTKGFWLAIPTPAAGTGAGGKRIDPGLWEQMHGSRLRFVYRRSGVSLLVADSMRARTGKRGGFAKGSASALRSGNGLASVVMFILVPQVTLRKRLDVAAAAEKWADAVPGLVIRNWR